MFYHLIPFIIQSYPPYSPKNRRLKTWWYVPFNLGSSFAMNVSQPTNLIAARNNWNRLYIIFKYFPRLPGSLSRLIYITTIPRSTSSNGNNECMGKWLNNTTGYKYGCSLANSHSANKSWERRHRKETEYCKTAIFNWLVIRQGC